MIAQKKTFYYNCPTPKYKQSVSLKKSLPTLKKTYEDAIS